MEIKQIEHINKSTVDKHKLNPEEVSKYRQKFYNQTDGSLFGDQTSSAAKMEWQNPEGEVEREFAIDMIIQ